MTGSQDRPGVLDSDSFQPSSFRLLIVGKTGVGKTSLINQAFGVDLPVSHTIAGKHDIEKEIISPINDMFILHDSRGLEDDQPEYYDTVRNFIEARRAQPDVKDQLHAIWLCCSLSDLTPVGTYDRKILATYCDQLPVVMVFTKLDQLDEEIRIVIDDGNPDAEPHVKDLLVKDEIKSVLHSNYLEPIRRYMGKEKFPHVKVSVFAPHGPSVERLVELTQQLLTERFGPLANNSAAQGVSVAQRVHPDVKIQLSTEIALKETLDSLDSKTSLDSHLESVHQKLIQIWNFDGGILVLSANRLMPRLRSGLRDPDRQKTDDIISLSNATIIVIYVTDFIFILRMIFHRTRTPKGICTLDGALVDGVINAYATQQRDKVHEEVKNYLSKPGNCAEKSPEAAAQFLREFISRHRLRLSIGAPTILNQARLPEKHAYESASPAKHKDERTSSLSTPHADLPVTHKDGHTLSRYESFMAAATDDGDVPVGTVKLKLKRKMRTTRKIMVKIVKTHQRYHEVVPESDKWAACLRFRLEVQGDTCPILKLTGTLQDDGYRRSNNQGMLEIVNVDPPPPTGDSPNANIQRESTQTLTAGITAGGNTHLPTANLSYSTQSKKGWTETHAIIHTTFDNIPPRKEFKMDFSHPPGADSIPARLFFTILVAYPSRPTPFTLDLLFTYGETGSCSVTCDGESEIKKSTDPVQ